MIIYNPIDQFEVVGIFQFDAFMLNTNLTFTNLGFYSLFVFGLIIGLHYMTLTNIKLVPTR